MPRVSESSPPAPPPAGLAAGSYLSFAHLGLSVAALGPALPFLAEATSTSLGAASSVFVAQNLGYMLGSYFGGRLYDRLAGTRLLSVGMWAMLPVLALIPLARSLALLLGAIAALGVLQGLVDVGGNMLILWTPPEGRSFRMNALHLAFGAGAFLCPLIMAQAVRLTGGIRWEYWSLAILVVPVGSFLLRLAPFRGRHVSSSAGGGRSWALGIVLVSALIFLNVAAEAGYGSWVYTYALRRRLADTVSAAYLVSVFWGAFTAGRLTSTLLAVRLQPLPMILASLGGCLAAAAALLAWPDRPAAAWACTAAYGFFMGPLFANILTLAGEVMTLTGRITGIFLVGTSLGGLFLPWLIGQLFESVGPVVMPAALLVDLAAALLCCLLLRLAIARRAATAAGSR
jgi:FHS family Na+ dependent glucose MFS transporter 1